MYIEGPQYRQNGDENIRNYYIPREKSEITDLFLFLIYKDKIVFLIFINIFKIDNL